MQDWDNSYIKSSFSLMGIAQLCCSDRDYDVCAWVNWLSVLEKQIYTSKYGFSVDFFTQSQSIPSNI